MNYRHAYHAGNFADILKHAVVTIVIEHLKKKDKPFFVLDTHGGQGVYDLSGEEAGKTNEFRSGILRLLDAPSLPAELIPYVQVVRAVNDVDQAIHRYPGSPALIRSLLRESDRLAVCEIQMPEAKCLRQLFKNDPRVNVHQRDGYNALKAFLPPNERRGMVLIDPSFETRNEFDTLADSFLQAQRRWLTGIYLLWYPIKDPSRSESFVEKIRFSARSTTISMEMKIRPDYDPARLNGCGLIVVNPPWTLEAIMTRLLPWLLECLGEPGGAWSLRRLQTEDEGADQYITQAPSNQI